MRKIDIFNHIWPTEFFDALIGHIGQMTDITLRSGAVPMITDLDRRFEVMDIFDPGLAATREDRRPRKSTGTQYGWLRFNGFAL